jgi:hypothetical protein
MTGLFSTADSLFGGTHIRPALTAYLSGDVAHWLRNPGPPEARRELTAAVAELGYLAAFVCFDSGLHGLAQRYYLASLGLAEHSGDPMLRATILRGMSVQAYSLRHVRDALRLAEAADAHSRGLPPARAAALAGQLAVASAANGLRREASTHLRRAESLLDECDSADEPVGAYHRSSLGHQTAEVLAAGGDRRGAIGVLSSSIRQRPDGDRRPALRGLPLSPLGPDRRLARRAAHAVAALLPQRRGARDSRPDQCPVPVSRAHRPPGAVQHVQHRRSPNAFRPAPPRRSTGYGPAGPIGGPFPPSASRRAKS